jgi:hypothetical protein
MGAFQEKKITIRTEILEETERGAILEIAFKGIHDHNWPHGRKIISFVTEEILRIKPSAVLFNFLEYRYDFGNEIADPIMAACFGREHHAPLPFAIVAQGITSRSLKSLFRFSKLETVFKYGFFEAVVDGWAFLRNVLDQVEPLASPQ